MTKNGYISNRLKLQRGKHLRFKRSSIQNKYLTILFFSQHYTHLDTYPNFPPCTIIIYGSIEPIVNSTSLDLFEFEDEFTIFIISVGSVGAQKALAVLCLMY